MFGNSNLSPHKRGMMANVAQNFINSQWGEGVTELLAAKEQTLVERVAQLADATDLADPEDIAPDLDADERATEIRVGIEALISGEFAAWFVEWFEWGEKPGRLAALADSDSADVDERMRGWVHEYRESSQDGLPHRSDRDIIRMHVQGSFGLSLQGFARAVHWPDNTHERALRRVLVGRVEDAEAGIDAMIEAAQVPEGYDGA